MKKILAAILSLTMCAVMLTACGKDDAEVTDLTEMTSSSEAEITTAETTAVETEAPKAAEHSFENLDDFIEEAFELKTETVPESLFSKYAEENLNDKGLYFDMETPDGSMDMLLAADSEANMYISAEGGGESINIYVIDGIMYMLDSKEKTGFSMALDNETVDSLTDEVMGGMDIGSELEGEDRSSECVDVEIDGEFYTFENLEEIGVLFDEDGGIYAVINGDEDESVRAFIVNEMSSNVPEGIIVLPTDYEIIDMEGLLAGLEDEGTADSGDTGNTYENSDFATMEEFLKTDFTALEGTAYAAEDSLSARVYSIFTSDRMYASSATDDGTLMTVVIADGKVVLEGDFGDTGSTIKFIILDDVFYAVSEADKAAIVSSNEDFGTADEIIAASRGTFEDIPFEDSYDITRAEVIIGGKKYIVESSVDKDSCLIFDEYEEVVAIVNDGEYSEWIITDKIPEGIFDIPSDYQVIDMRDME